MNRQLHRWLDTVANVRLHGTTDRIVDEQFAEERPMVAGTAVHPLLRGR